MFVSLLVESPIARADELSKNRKQSSDDKVLRRGEMIWRQSCAECHGANGEGVKEAYQKPLIGDSTPQELAAVIADTMPQDEPEKCVGDDAQAVARWLHQAFYSEAARARKPAPRRKLSHLTGDQLRQSLADLFQHSRGSMWRESKRGASATYYDGARPRRDSRKFERVDPVIAFDWGKSSPGGGLSPESFYVRWRTGLKIDETGRYEIVMRSTAAFKMAFGSFSRPLIDNYVQSGDKTEFRRSLTLLAGRVYPLQIELIQRKRKTEQPPVEISLSWVPPHGAEQVIPSRHLIPTSPPATFALQTKLPPDDRSYGYDRGLAVDRSWDDSTTQAAIEFAAIAVRELWPEYERRHRRDSDENRARLRNFVGELAALAFRGPLDDDARKFYVDDQIDVTEDDATAIRRCLLAILKSPRFLYPTLDRDRSVSQQRANRLALVLWDSLPTGELLSAAVANGELRTDDQIRSAAQAMVRDYRCEGKTRQMLLEWLNLAHADEAAKDADQFPQFDRQLVGDLRASFQSLLDNTVLDEDGDFQQLFRADWLYTTARLTQFYGAEWQASEPDSSSAEERSDEGSPGAGSLDAGAESVAGAVESPPLTRVVAGPNYSHGILSHPYLMSRLAYADATSPIHRGVFLNRYMLGRVLSPPNEAFTPLSPGLHPDLTTRERVELQTSAKSCRVCHSKINALGFALENFDPVGRFRLQDNRKAVDPSGGYIDRKGTIFSFAGVGDLAEYLADSEDAHRAFVTRAFQHFVKQPIAAYGPRKIDELTEKFRATGFRLHPLLVEIAVIAATPTSQPAVSPDQGS